LRHFGLRGRWLNRSWNQLDVSRCGYLQIGHPAIGMAWRGTGVARAAVWASIGMAVHTVRTVHTGVCRDADDYAGTAFGLAGRGAAIACSTVWAGIGLGAAIGLRYWPDCRDVLSRCDGVGPCGANDRWFALPAVGLARWGTTISFAALWTEIILAMGAWFGRGSTVRPTELQVGLLFGTVPTGFVPARWLDRQMAFRVARRERGRRGAWLGGDKPQASNGLLARRSLACGHLCRRWTFCAADLQPPTKHDVSRARDVNEQI